MKIWPLVLALAFPAAALAADDPQVIPDVVYGHKDGMALTYDVLIHVPTEGARSGRGER
jgi:hypothetical protein